MAPLSLLFVCILFAPKLRDWLGRMHISNQLQHSLILSLSFQDFLFHAATFVFYFGAFLLQAATTSLHNYRCPSNATVLLSGQDYNISIAASVSISQIYIKRWKSVLTLFSYPTNLMANWNVNFLGKGLSVFVCYTALYIHILII